MGAINSEDEKNLAIARRWCEKRGVGWQLVATAGRGGTAPVYEVTSPDGPRALKLLDEDYSTGDARNESLRRVRMQCEQIGIHDCPNLVNVYEGGEFEDRLFLVMNKAPGAELAKKLQVIPREKIAGIVDQIARACIFLRERGLCHRDIKSENIFVTDDFSKAILLDVSVVRNIYDPIGIGTDHGNKLPVVATSRYTPPEYLFRLVDPGKELWHAVDIYQLGCLIHDLVMRVQMFDEEYQRSADNRYRFAWIVATKTPRLTAADVDTALILLGQRALDKKYERRSFLQLEDFLEEKESRSKLGLDVIGLGGVQAPVLQSSTPVNIRQLLQFQAKALEEKIRAFQAEKGVRAVHDATALDDLHWSISFDWTTKAERLNQVRLSYKLRCETTPDEISIGLSAHLEISDSQDQLSASLEIPPIPFSDDIESALFSSAVASITELANQAMNQSTGE